MSFEQFVDWWEPQPERPDPDNPEKTLPARAGAVCRSDEDFTRYKIALEQACALLKDRCTPEMKASIENVTGNTADLLKRGQKTKEILGNGKIFTEIKEKEKGPF